VYILITFLGALLGVQTDCVQDLGVMLDSKFYFHRNIDYLHSQALKLLRLFRFITYKFSSFDSLKFYILFQFFQRLSTRLSSGIILL
jgi:hypothetical protein